MFSLLRNRFGIPGVISVIALVFAMLGGAYAASNGLSGKQKKEVKAIAKGFQGTGPAGPQGPAGANGAKGDTGAKGDKGDTGNAGTPGTSVTNTKLNPGNVNCSEGGAEFKVGSGTPTFACNGEEGPEGLEGLEGPEGPEGKPWTPNSTLPSGATETGAWAFSGGVQTFKADVGGEEEEITVGNPEVRVPISIPIELPSPLSDPGINVHYSTQANFRDFDGDATNGEFGCTGNSGSPAAPKGHLCIFQGGPLTSATFVEMFKPDSNSEGSSVVGGYLLFSITGPNAAGGGSWAVTAP
jgi:hypothetical protein